MPTRPTRPSREDHAEDGALIGYDETLRIANRARTSANSAQHRIRLRLELTPPAERHGISLDGKTVGLQDRARDVHRGTPVEGTNRLRWETLVVLIMDPTGPTRWLGAAVHGPKDDRFLYLAWPADSAEWDGMRIKIQFRYAEALIPKIIKAKSPLLSADVTGRVPHDTTPVPWQVQALKT